MGMFYSTNISGVRQGVNKASHIDTRQAKSVQNRNHSDKYVNLCNPDILFGISAAQSQSLYSLTHRDISGWDEVGLLFEDDIGEVKLLQVTDEGIQLVNFELAMEKYDYLQSLVVLRPFNPKNIPETSERLNALQELYMSLHNHPLDWCIYEHDKIWKDVDKDVSDSLLITVFERVKKHLDVLSPIMDMEITRLFNLIDLDMTGKISKSGLEIRPSVVGNNLSKEEMKILRRALLDNKDEEMTLEQLKQSYIKNSQQEIPKDMNLIGIVSAEMVYRILELCHFLGKKDDKTLITPESFGSFSSDIPFLLPNMYGKEVVVHPIALLPEDQRPTKDEKGSGIKHYQFLFKSNYVDGEYGNPRPDVVIEDTKTGDITRIRDHTSLGNNSPTRRTVIKNPISTRGNSTRPNSTIHRNNNFGTAKTSRAPSSMARRSSMNMITPKTTKGNNFTKRMSIGSQGKRRSSATFFP